MGLLVNLGEKKSLTFASTDVRGISLVSYFTRLQGGGDGTPVGGGTGDPNVIGIDWSRVYINIVLNQGGKSTQICATTVKPLAQHLNFLNKGFDFCANYQTAQQYDSSTGTDIGDATLDFGSVINLRGDDSLVCEIRVQSDAISSNYSAQTAYVEADVIEGVGLQYITPKFETFAINGGESKFSHSLGENVTAVSLQNISSSPTADYNSSPWQNARLFSDRYNVNDDWGQLWSRRNQYFDGDFYRNQSFILSLETTDDTQVQLDLFPTNNLTNDNYLCYSSYETSQKIVVEASRRSKKHEAKAIRKIKKG